MHVCHVQLACAWNRLMPNPHAIRAQMCEESMNHGEAVLDWWKRTNGLQTQESWVTNYRKHPGPWAGLLSIHGVRPGCTFGRVSGMQV